MKKILIGLTLLASMSSFAHTTELSRPGETSGLFISKLLYSAMNVAMVMDGRDVSDKPDFAFYHFEKMPVSDYISIVTGEVSTHGSDLGVLLDGSKGLAEAIKYLVTITDGDITPKEAYEAFRTNKTVLDLANDLHEELNSDN